MLETLFQFVVLDEIIAKILSLILLGSAFLATYRAGYVNLAMSAQLVGGAIVGCIVGSWSGSLALATTVSFGVILLLAAVPTALRYFLDVDEVLTTLLFWFMSVPLAQYVIRSLSGPEAISAPKVPFVGRLGLSPFHELNWPLLATIPLLLIAGYVVSFTTLGYTARVIRWSESVLSNRRQFWQVMKLHVIASLLLTCLVVAYTFTTWGKYTPPAFFREGFEGIAVALIALLRFAFIPVSACIVSVVWIVFVHASIRYGLPEMGSFIVNGAFLVTAAVFLAKRRRAA